MIVRDVTTKFGHWLSKRFRKWALDCLYAARPIRQRMLSGGHMLLRRQAIEAAGGLFDPGFFLYYEDTDLCRRLQSAGFSLLLDPRARVVHEWRNDPGKGRYVADSRRRYLDKHFPGSRLVERSRERIERRPPKTVVSFQDLGVCGSPPSLDLPTQKAGQWLLELSPHPLFIPSAYSRGHVPPCNIPPHISELLGAGRYWARVTTPGNQELVFAWDLS